MIMPGWIPSYLPENRAPGAWIPAAFTPRIPDYAKMDPLLIPENLAPGARIPAAFTPSIS